VISDLREYIYDHSPRTLTISQLLDLMVNLIQKAEHEDMSTRVHLRPFSPHTHDPRGGAGAPAVSVSSPPARSPAAAASADGGEEGEDEGSVQQRDDGGGDDAESNEGSDFEYTYEGEDDDDDGAPAGAGSSMGDPQWLYEHLKRQRWLGKLEEIRAAASDANSDSSKNEFGGLEGAALQKAKSTQSRQIFTTEASGNVLISDLLTLKRAEAKLGYTVDTVDDNIHHWRVRMEKFDSSSPLAEDLFALRSRCGYSYVELELNFAMDLYPFFPPLVRLVRPKFHGFLMGRIASMETLQLSHWDGVRDMGSVLGDIRVGLEQWARLDVTNPLNDIALHPAGSYTELEHLLMRLGLVTEAKPRAAGLHVTAPNLRPEACGDADVPPEKKRLKGETLVPDSDEQGQHYRARPTKLRAAGWAKGTGYGHGAQRNWDVKSYLAAQQERDRLVVEILVKIKHILSTAPSHDASEGSCTAEMKGKGKGKYKCKQGTGKEDVAVKKQRGKGKNLHWDALKWEVVMQSYRPLEESCLVPFLQQHLGNDSLLDAERHKLLFRTTLELVRCLSRWEHLRPLLLPLENQPPNKSLFRLLSCLNERALVYARATSRAAAAAESQAKYSQSVPKESKGQEGETDDNGEGEEDSLMSLVQDVYEEVAALVDEQQVTQLEDEIKTSRLKEEAEVVAGAGPGMESNDSLTLYREVMQPLQFDDLPTLPNFLHERDTRGASFGLNKQRVRRLAQEHSDLSQSLPLSLSSTIFVRTHAEFMDRMRAVITGPDDTPYAGGIFVFDVWFPCNYPASPPKVLLCTTGGGSVRFNPNLYNCGKVCLSLLGTWGGAHGETWSADTSTLLQVLVSIQSLILGVNEPYFNEPGYENTMGTEEGVRQSKSYNSKIRQATLRWAILEHLKNPPKGFEDVVAAHFYLRRDFIMKTAMEWERESTNQDLSTLVRDICSWLSSLKPPSLIDK
jgi:baculoviral IAP repeat-containing protein 6